MKDTYILKLNSGKYINFRIKSYHYLNPDLNRMFDDENPTIIALYKREGSKFKLINVHVINNPRTFFNTQPVSDELRDTVLVLQINESLQPMKEKVRDHLERIQHEIIEVLPTFLQEG